LFSGRNAACAAALAGGVALYAVNIYIATTVLPSVVADIGGLHLYSWNTTLFVVASILGSALSTRLLGSQGSRRAYLISAAVFMAGSGACALAPSMPVMLAGRTVQGLGGGLLFALSYSMINIVLPERLWPRAMALTSAMWGVATLLGPAVGGVFAEWHAWRWAFGFLVPVTLAYGVFVWQVLPEGGANRNAKAPLALPQLLLLVAAALAVSAGSLAVQLSWNIASLALALLLVAVLVRVERNALRRLLPEGALRHGSPLLALYLTMALVVMGMTSETFVPYFLQRLHEQTPLASGYIAALMAVGWTVSEILSSGWQRRGIRFAIVAGPLFVVLGMVMLALNMPAIGGDGGHTMALICIGLGLVGFGIGLGWPHLLTQVLLVAPPADRDSAGASITTVQLFATALGAALAGMIVNQAGLGEQSDLPTVGNAAFWLFALFAIAPLAGWFMALRAVKTVRTD
jgi:MFS family permease